MITTSEVNRPALQLAGFYEHFSKDRVQIIGHVEESYLSAYSEEEKNAAFEKFVNSGIPCVVFTKHSDPTPAMIEIAKQGEVPLLKSQRNTSSIMAEIIRYLGVELAPSVSIHGVLVEVYGEGILITGESGIGKSEAALELIRRGHRLVSDDVVVIRKVSEATLVGSSPDVTRHFIEVRGIGIIDVMMLYGVEHVKDTSSIDLIIKLEEWDKEKMYDRLGITRETTEILGNKVTSHSIPLRPGRNLAVIVETAAVNHRQKKMGYSTAEELQKRVARSIENRRRQNEN